MMKRTSTILLITTSLVLLLGDLCFCADINTYKNDFITHIHEGYTQSAMAYGSIFVGYALNLFWWLVLLDLAYHLIIFVRQEDGDFGQLMIMLVFRVIYAGFFYLILDQGPAIVSFLYDTIVNDFARQMINAGVGATGWTVSQQTVSPADFLDIGFTICFKITERAGFWSATGLVTNIVAIILIILFMLIIAEILVAMVEYYMVASIGYILLAFGGLTATQSMVWSYFKTLFAMSFKIMSIYAVTSIAFGFIREVAGTDAQIDAIVSDTESLLVLLAGTCLFAILAKKVPERLTAVITGAMFNGAVNAGAASMVRGLMAVGAGAAVGATVSAAGAGSAVSSAVGLAKAQGAAGGNGSVVNNANTGSPQSLASLAGRTMQNIVGAAGETLMSKGVKGENTFANSLGTMANRMDNKKEKISATEAVSGAGSYKPPTTEDIKNTLKGKNNS
jgi:P-type conjugative transfer protein TrbL